MKLVSAQKTLPMTKALLLAKVSPLGGKLMGAGHDDGNAGHQGHSHGAGASTRRLAIALGLTTTFLIAELVGAFSDAQSAQVCAARVARD